MDKELRLDPMDLPAQEVQTYEQLQEDRDWWKNKYFQLYEYAGQMMSALAERTIFNGSTNDLEPVNLDENHSADGDDYL